MNIPISYKWLESHFEKEIPKAEDIALLFMKHLCEVEGMEKKDDDTIFDLKIMPDRGHDLLSHRGIANEVAVLAGVPMKVVPFLETTSKDTQKLKVTVEDAKLCPRYMGRIVENIKVGASPVWLRERLESVGQRSINNIVDITNFVMLEFGQPMHAFDLAKLAGAELVVRKARDSERILTLDGKDIELTPDTLVIADQKQALAIAGVKGGKDAGVDHMTTSIIFEAANFDAVNTRRTSARVGIRTDSSRRFEHELSPELAREAMSLATELVLETCPQARIGEVTDVYPDPQTPRKVNISIKELNGILGTKLSREEVLAILERLHFPYMQAGDILTVDVPLVRLDLCAKEDLAEEIGRVYGFDKVPNTPIPDIAFKAHPLKAYHYANVIRDTLIEYGFSEVLTYSFQNDGVFAVANPIASDKGFLRKDLATGLGQALALNARNAPLLGLDDIQIFEIGKTFPGVMEEKLSCAIGIELTKGGKKKDALARDMLEMRRICLGEKLNVEIDGVPNGNVFEFDLGALLQELPEPEVDAPFKAVIRRYVRPSAYPFMLRDISLWVPSNIAPDIVSGIITREAGSLLCKEPRLFDSFENPVRKETSYAFNLVFQSYEKTLSDDEVNTIMERVQSALAKEGYEVR